MPVINPVMKDHIPEQNRVGAVLAAEVQNFSNAVSQGTATAEFIASAAARVRKVGADFLAFCIAIGTDRARKGGQEIDSLAQQIASDFLATPASTVTGPVVPSEPPVIVGPGGGGNGQAPVDHIPEQNRAHAALETLVLTFQEAVDSNRATAAYISQMASKARQVGDNFMAYCQAIGTERALRGGEEVQALAHQIAADMMNTPPSVLLGPKPATPATPKGPSGPVVVNSPYGDYEEEIPEEDPTPKGGGTYYGGIPSGGGGGGGTYYGPASDPIPAAEPYAPIYVIGGILGLLAVYTYARQGRRS